MAIKFDLTSIPSNAKITSATFSIYRISYTNSLHDKNSKFLLHKMNTEWNYTYPNWYDCEKTNWNDPEEKYDPNTIDQQSYTTGQTGWFSFDVESVIQNYVSDSNENHGFLLINEWVPTDQTSGATSVFASAEHQTSSWRPKLEIEYEKDSAVYNETIYKQTEKFKVERVDGVFVINSATKVPNAKVRVYSLSGKRISNVNRKLIAGSNFINEISNLSKGTYLINIVEDKNLKYSKQIFVD